MGYFHAGQDMPVELMGYLLRTEVYGGCTPDEFERIPMRQRLRDWTLYAHHHQAQSMNHGGAM